jgi:hypothetical protein
MLTQDFYSYSTTARMQEVEQRMEQMPRRINRRMASYVTVDTTQKTDKKTSQSVHVIKFPFLDFKASTPSTHNRLFAIISELFKVMLSHSTKGIGNSAVVLVKKPCRCAVIGTLYYIGINVKLR